MLTHFAREPTPPPIGVSGHLHHQRRTDTCIAHRSVESAPSPARDVRLRGGRKSCDPDRAVATPDRQAPSQPQGNGRASAPARRSAFGGGRFSDGVLGGIVAARCADTSASGCSCALCASGRRTVRLSSSNTRSPRSRWRLVLARFVHVRASIVRAAELTVNEHSSMPGPTRQPIADPLHSGTRHQDAPGTYRHTASRDGRATKPIALEKDIIPPQSRHRATSGILRARRYRHAERTQSVPPARSGITPSSPSRVAENSVARTASTQLWEEKHCSSREGAGTRAGGRPSAKGRTRTQTAVVSVAFSGAIVIVRCACTSASRAASRLEPRYASVIAANSACETLGHAACYQEP
ncbi:hypothetical protein VTO73DRAFT_12221 [Trametes versicolor]